MLKGVHNFISRALFLTVIIILNSCQDVQQQAKGESDLVVAAVEMPDSVDFSLHIKPLISDRCFKCHGPDKNAVEGNLSLQSAEEAYKALGEHADRFAIKPGDVAASELVRRIYSDDPGLLMPPPESNLVLSDYEKALLSKWIEQGAEYKEHWAFVKPEKPQVPTINAYEAEGETIPWGRNEIDAFVLKKLQENKIAPSPEAAPELLVRRMYLDLTGLPPSLEELNRFTAERTNYDVVLDSLFGSDDYAEHMAAGWMEVARYADTHGYQDDFERTMWPWRDWVIHAFKQNMPYDRFVTVQLAGDLVTDRDVSTLLATGFNRNHKITAEGGVIPEEYRTEYVEDRTNTFGTAFLGLTLECARCHDHKYDPISQQEHFELFSFFNNVDEEGLIQMAQPAPRPNITITKAEAQGVLDFINMDKATQAQVQVMVMNEMDTKRPTYILDRGVYDRPTEQVFPATPDRVLPFPEAYPENRLGLSQWLFHKDHPLTARVMVNRIWQRMFGKGLVETADDFGNQGALPSHPELLDYLAVTFMEEGWDIQKMIRRIANSATYRQSSRIRPELLERDPENRLLARAPRLRLSAGSIRDQALKISGLLNPEVGGPSVKPYQPEGLWEETTGGGGGSTASYVPSMGPDLYRKSLYTFWKRTVPPPSMLTFDASSRDICSVRREETNTPLQALVLLNDPQMIEAERLWAQNTLSKAATPEEQLRNMFRAATAREPGDSELQRLLAFYKENLERIESGEILPEAYLNIGAYRPEEAPKDLKGWTSLSLVAQTILNMDETITRS